MGLVDALEALAFLCQVGETDHETHHGTCAELEEEGGFHAPLLDHGSGEAEPDLFVEVGAAVFAVSFRLFVSETEMETLKPAFISMWDGACCAFIR